MTGSFNDHPFESSGIPVFWLSIDPAEFDKVNESHDHSYRAHTGSVRITVPDGCTAGCGTGTPAEAQELELDYIRGRGNGTWYSDKRPYRLKLKKKADLLGMGENRHWVLLANSYDPSLLRNRLASYMGERLGLPFTSKCLPVDLVVNGQYRGSYLLSENVRLGKNRVDIDELTEKDTEDPELTGGYLLHIFLKASEPAENVFVSDRMVRFGTDSPKFGEGEAGLKQQKEYIDGYLQRTEDAVFSADFRDREGVSYTDLMDIASAAKYWWVQELSANPDGMRTSSTYLYKKRGGKLCWGPLWDFDIAFGSADEDPSGFGSCRMVWLDRLRACEPEYQRALTETWKVLDGILDNVLMDGGVLDTYAEQIRESWHRDRALMDSGQEEGSGPDGFDEQVGRLKAWLKERRDWIDSNVGRELFHVFDTVTLLADGGQQALPRCSAADGVILSRCRTPPSGRTQRSWDGRGMTAPCSAMKMKWKVIRCCMPYTSPWMRRSRRRISFSAPATCGLISGRDRTDAHTHWSRKTRWNARSSGHHQTLIRLRWTATAY